MSLKQRVERLTAKLPKTREPIVFQWVSDSDVLFENVLTPKRDGGWDSEETIPLREREAR